MKISTKGRYGLEAILDLAIHSEDKPINLKSIATRCDISEAYILQIFLKLRRGGIVKSIRGPKGGYILAKEPDSITVADVLFVLEGPLTPVECIENKECNCDRYEKCETRPLWQKISTRLIKTTENITIQDLMKGYKKRIEHKGDVEYYI